MPAYRADEVKPPPPRFTTELLEDAIRATVAQVSAPVPDELGAGRVGWGQQLDTRPLTTTERRKVAGYLAKYATKSTEQAGGLLHRITRDEVDTAPVREHVRCYLRQAFTLDQDARARAKELASTDINRPSAAVGPPAETARAANALSYRAYRAISADECVTIRLRHDGGEHTTRIRGCTTKPAVGWDVDDRAAPAPTRLTLDDGTIIDLDQVAVIAHASDRPEEPEAATDRRLAACAHAFGYRGHCLTKIRRYSTTFKALRQARERHVHEQLLKRSHDQSQRALAELADSARIATFTYAGQGHLTTADAFLAASAAARAREARRLAHEEAAWARSTRNALWQGESDDQSCPEAADMRETTGVNVTAPSGGPVERLAYSPAEIAAAFGLSRRAIYRAIAAGELRAARVCSGSRLRVPVDEARAWVERNLLEAEPARGRPMPGAASGSDDRPLRAALAELDAGRRAA